MRKFLLTPKQETISTTALNSASNAIRELRVSLLPFFNAEDAENAEGSQRNPFCSFAALRPSAPLRALRLILLIQLVRFAGLRLARISHRPPAAAPYVAPWTASEPTIRSSTCRKHASGRIADSSLPGHDLRRLATVSGEKRGLTRISSSFRRRTSRASAALRFVDHSSSGDET